MNNYRISAYENGILMEVWYFQARTEKGVLKANKNTFRNYRKLNYIWKIEECE